jgi:hypothetical protein
VDIVINLFDGEPGSLFLVAAEKTRLPILKVKIRLLGYRQNLLPAPALPALSPELFCSNAALGHCFVIARPRGQRQASPLQKGLLQGFIIPIDRYLLEPSIRYT